MQEDNDDDPTVADLIDRLERDWRRWSILYLIVGALLVAAVAVLAITVINSL